MSIQYWDWFTDIDFIEFTIKDEIDNIINTLIDTSPDIIGFSCYIWNMNYIKNVLLSLKKKIKSHFILGGPQVICQGKTYLVPEDENIIICNGFCNPG